MTRWVGYAVVCLVFIVALNAMRLLIGEWAALTGFVAMLSAHLVMDDR